MTEDPSRTMQGEKIYEQELNLTSITDFGVSLDAIASGEKAIPLHGGRFDLAVEGRSSGRLSGRAHGFDYLRMRADGRMELDLHVTIETDDGHRIALSGDGQAAQRDGEPILEIFGNIRLSSAAEEYAWVNARQVWSVGTANLATRKIHATAYMQ